MSLKEFATRRAPLRASTLNALVKCPAWVILGDYRLNPTYEDRKSAAAHNGTAAGRAIELFHAGLGVGEALAMTEEESASGLRGRGFEMVKMTTVDAWVRRYCADPRNRPEIVLESSLEMEVELTLAAAPEDPTGEPIIITGHVDQIRRDRSGVLRLWDVKSGVLDGLDMLWTYAWQLAAYTVGAAEILNEPVLPGGVIRLRGYDSKAKLALANDPEWCAGRAVHFESQCTLATCHEMLETVAQHVAWIRLGLIHQHPGKHCGWCPAGGPHLCGTRLDEGCLA